MDRQQKIDQLANRSGRVSKVSNLEVQLNSVHPDYRVEPCDGILSETGKLEVLKVVSNFGSGPYFTARWDQRAEHLDIDMHEASKTAIRKFKGNKDGYSGHHTNRASNPDKRIFDITIKTPAGVIFDGTVSFSNTYKEIILMQSTSTVTAIANVMRADPKPESG